MTSHVRAGASSVLLRTIMNTSGSIVLDLSENKIKGNINFLLVVDIFLKFLRRSIKGVLSLGLVMTGQLHAHRSQPHGDRFPA